MTNTAARLNKQINQVKQKAMNMKTYRKTQRKLSAQERLLVQKIDAVMKATAACELGVDSDDIDWDKATLWGAEITDKFDTALGCEMNGITVQQYKRWKEANKDMKQAFRYVQGLGTSSAARLEILRKIMLGEMEDGVNLQTLLDYIKHSMRNANGTFTYFRNTDWEVTVR